MHLRPIVAIALCALTLACGKKSPTEPTAPTTPTRIIAVTGDLSFGNVDINTSSSRTFTIANSGNSVLTFTSIQASTGTGSTGWALSPTSGAVPAGGSITGTLRFLPTVAQFYGTVMTVVADQTSGNPAINITGTGVNNTPLFTRSGRGNTVFDIPSYVTRVRIQGTWDRRDTSNFIVRVAGRVVVNEILRDSITYDGTHLLTSGGTAEIVSSTNIDWVFTEVR